MTRMRIAIAAVLSLTASTVQAQSTHFTVSAASASVYKAPTNVSPVIGEAKQGATLEVTRDVGSWVKVAWSKAPDGVGYVRKNAGTLGTLGAAVPATAAAPGAKQAAAPQAAPASTSVGAPAAAAPRAASAQAGPVSRPRPSASVPTNYVAPSHRFGVGGQVGGTAVGAGFSVRGWTKAQKIGVQFDVTHSSMTNDVFFTRMSSTQFGPRVLYAFSDHVSDSTWVRPYLGAGAHMLRASVSDAGTGLSTSSTKMAAQLFGGAEITLAAVPRLGLSADVGYQWYQSPFVGYTLDGMMMSVSAHWYLK
jgi:SH3 domain-containing protein